MIKQLLAKNLIAAMCAAAPLAALAAEFPTQPIRLLVGYSAGGSVDIVARAFAQRMAREIGQSVVVENRGGASGILAAQTIVNARPDGYNLYFVASPTVTIAPAIQKTSFDPLKDFTPIAAIVNYFNVLMVRADSPHKTVTDLIDEARANPGTLTYGSAGVGAANHLSGELLADKAGVKLTHVPYKGNAPALMDLMAGRISFAFDVNNTAMNHIENGKLRALAVTSATRSPRFPDVPTLMESGYEDVEFTGWFGLLAPPGMPGPIAQRIAAATQKIVAEESFQKQMAASGYTMANSNSEELLERMAREGKLFSELAQRANLRQD